MINLLYYNGGQNCIKNIFADRFLTLYLKQGKGGKRNLEALKPEKIKIKFIKRKIIIKIAVISIRTRVNERSKLIKIKKF